MVLVLEVGWAARERGMDPSPEMALLQRSRSLRGVLAWIQLWTWSPGCPH